MKPVSMPRVPGARKHFFSIGAFMVLMGLLVKGQYSPQTYPDPRIDPIACKTALPGQVCDPAEILLPEERRSLMEKITKLQSITASIKNTAPACAGQSSNLYIIIALIEKLGTLPFESVSIERFTNLLRSRYQNFQDVSLCDTMVLIMNSRMDRQVFTVAGRDAKLSRDMLQTAFQRNVGHFRTSNYALGLEGMVEYIGAAYSNAHIIQVPSPEVGFRTGMELPESVSPPVLGGGQLPTKPVGVTTASGQFITHGVRQKPDIKIPHMEKFNMESVPEEDRLWIQLMMRAAQQCGYDAEKMGENVRAIVEDAMSLSLRLIADSRYNKIEEDSQTAETGRDSAWLKARSFIDDLYARWGAKFPRRANLCPAQSGEDTMKALPSRSRLL